MSCPPVLPRFWWNHELLESIAGPAYCYFHWCLFPRLHRDEWSKCLPQGSWWSASSSPLSEEIVWTRFSHGSRSSIITSAIALLNIFTMTHAGFEGVMLIVVSWSQWLEYPDLPKVLGDKGEGWSQHKIPFSAKLPSGIWGNIPFTYIPPLLFPGSHFPDHIFPDSIDTLQSAFRLPPHRYIAGWSHRLGMNIDTMNFPLCENGIRIESVHYPLFFLRDTAICKSRISRVRKFLIDSI